MDRLALALGIAFFAFSALFFGALAGVQVERKALIPTIASGTLSSLAFAGAYALAALV